MACLDTDILVELMKGDGEAIKTVERLDKTGQTVKTTAITAYELLKGAAISSRPAQNLVRVRGLLSSIEILSLELGACEQASAVYADLRGAGEMVGEFDILIAAIAMYNGEPLVSRDEHFRPVQNLKLRKW